MSIENVVLTRFFYLEATRFLQISPAGARNKRSSAKMRVSRKNFVDNIFFIRYNFENTLFKVYSNFKLYYI